MTKILIQREYLGMMHSRAILVTIDNQDKAIWQLPTLSKFEWTKSDFNEEYIWESKFEKNLKKLLKSFQSDISKDTEIIKLPDLHSYLKKIFNRTIQTINKAYLQYKVTKQIKIFSKKIEKERLDLINRLENAVILLIQDLNNIGYKSHTFLEFLKQLSNKCLEDKKYIGILDSLKK